MSRDYSDHYSWHGPVSGEDGCDPPEPGKEWLTIEEDGEEIAVIVLRVDAFEGRPNDLALLREEHRERADRVVAALNAYNEEGVPQ